MSGDTLILTKMYEISGWLKDLIYINLLWLLFNVPTLFLFSMYYAAKGVNEFIYVSSFLLIDISVVVIPTVIVVFKLIRELLIGKKRENGLFVLFWGYYREDFWVNILRGLIVTLIWFIIVVDYYYFINYLGFVSKYAFMIIFIFLFIVTINYFSVVTHFKSSFFQEFKNALYITIGSPVAALKIGFFNIGLIYICIYYFTFLIPLLLISLIALVSFINIKRLFLEIESRNFNLE